MAEKLTKDTINEVSGGHNGNPGFSMVNGSTVRPGVTDGVLEFTDNDMVRRFAEFRHSRDNIYDVNQVEDSILNHSFNRRVELESGEYEAFLNYLNNRNH